MTWLSTAQAARLAGVNRTTYMQWAKLRGLTCKVVKNGLRVGYMWREDEVLGLEIENRCNNAEVGRPSEIGTAVALVAWADSLTEWPSDEEIESRVTRAYRVKDIEGILETRVYRKRSPLRKRVPVLTQVGAIG